MSPALIEQVAQEVPDPGWRTELEVANHFEVSYGVLLENASQVEQRLPLGAANPAVRNHTAATTNPPALFPRALPGRTWATVGVQLSTTLSGNATGPAWSSPSAGDSQQVAPPLQAPYPCAALRVTPTLTTCPTSVPAPTSGYSEGVIPPHPPTQNPPTRTPATKTPKSRHAITLANLPTPNLSADTGSSSS